MRLLAVLAVLAFALAYPRATLMLAVVVASATFAIVRVLLRHRTVFCLGTYRVPVSPPARAVRYA